VIDVEEAAAEAFATAVERWPADGVPPNPGAWLTTTANHKAIDRIPIKTPRAAAAGPGAIRSAQYPHEVVSFDGRHCTVIGHER
jgi:RNA polymerase sigma-70 factor, ECF subfamily